MIHLRLRGLALSGAILSVCSVESAFAAQSDTGSVFVDVSVVPMNRDTVLAHQDIFVVDGRIEWIGPTGTTTFPTTAGRIDSRGKFLAPGLADMHVHLRDERELWLYVAHGVTSVRNMGGNLQHLRWRSQIQEGSRIGPVIYTSGPAVQASERLVGLNPPLIVVEEDVLVRTPDEARRTVAEQKAEGYDFVKLMWAPPDVYTALMDAARDVGFRVAGHVPSGRNSIGLGGALAAGQQSIEHLNGYEYVLVPDDAPIRPRRGLRSRLLSWNYADTTRFERWAVATAEAGTWNCPTIVTPQTRWLPEEEYQALLDRPEMRFRAPEALAAIRDRDLDLLHFSGRQSADFEEVQRSIEMRLRFVLSLQRAGAGLLAGTDASNGMPILQGAGLRRELANFVAAGLTPYEALRTATANAAMFLDDSDWGTIASGNRADLILLAANPLEDIDNLARLEGVMVHGRWLGRFELGELRQKLEEAFQR